MQSNIRRVSHYSSVVHQTYSIIHIPSSVINHLSPTSIVRHPAPIRAIHLPPQHASYGLPSSCTNHHRTPSSTYSHQPWLANQHKLFLLTDHHHRHRPNAPTPTRRRSPTPKKRATHQLHFDLGAQNGHQNASGTEPLSAESSRLPFRHLNGHSEGRDGAADAV